MPIDIIVIDEASFDDRSQEPGLVRVALREGRVLERVARPGTGVVPRGACMLAHQAAEKALEALLAARGIDPPKLHDLDGRAARLPEADNVRFDEIDLPELTRWAAEGRYPGDLEDATYTDAARTVDLARQVASQSVSVFCASAVTS